MKTSIKINTIAEVVSASPSGASCKINQRFAGIRQQHAAQGTHHMDGGDTTPVLTHRALPGLPTILVWGTGLAHEQEFPHQHASHWASGGADPRAATVLFYHHAGVLIRAEVWQGCSSSSPPQGVSGVTLKPVFTLNWSPKVGTDEKQPQEVMLVEGCVWREMSTAAWTSYARIGNDMLYGTACKLLCVVLPLPGSYCSSKRNNLYGKPWNQATQRNPPQVPAGPVGSCPKTWGRCAQAQLPPVFSYSIDTLNYILPC